MTEEHELRIPFKDLTKVVLECSNCSAELTIDISNTKQRTMSSGQRKTCPACNHAFDSMSERAFDHIFKWYDCVLSAPFADKVFFRIKKTL
jgi:hypothetical protein